MNYKGYILKPHPFSPGLTIVAKEGQGGSVPKQLTSAFTTKLEAIAVIDSYMMAPTETEKEAPRVRKTNPKN